MSILNGTAVQTNEEGTRPLLREQHERMLPPHTSLPLLNPPHPEPRPHHFGTMYESAIERPYLLRRSGAMTVMQRLVYMKEGCFDDPDVCDARLRRFFWCLEEVDACAESGTKPTLSLSEIHNGVYTASCKSKGWPLERRKMELRRKGFEEKDGYLLLCDISREIACNEQRRLVQRLRGHKISDPKRFCKVSAFQKESKGESKGRFRRLSYVCGHYDFEDGNSAGVHICISSVLLEDWITNRVQSDKVFGFSSIKVI